MTIAVVIPHLPSRADLLQRALASVHRQTLQPSQIIVSVDHDHRGAAHARNRGLSRVKTPLVAFLDDDDEFKPNHLQVLSDAQRATGADLVYPWFDVAGGGVDPLGAEGKLFDPVALRQANHIPVTTLCRTDAVRAAGGFRNKYPVGATCEDWACWLAMLEAGSKFVHLPLRTWVWHREHRGTGGQVACDQERVL